MYYSFLVRYHLISTTNRDSQNNDHRFDGKNPVLKRPRNQNSKILNSGFPTKNMLCGATMDFESLFSKRKVNIDLRQNRRCFLSDRCRISSGYFVYKYHTIFFLATVQLSSLFFTVLYLDQTLHHYFHARHCMDLCAT